MSAMPPSPRPPAAPQPPRTGSHLLTISLLVLALIIVVSVLTVVVGIRFLARGVKINVAEAGAGKKEVSIKTPVGSLEVRPEVNEARLGLPIYPGAERRPGEGSASVNIAFPNEEGVRVVAAKYQTADSLEKVRDFYKQRLGDEVTKFTPRSREGHAIFEIKRSGQEKIVSIHAAGPVTQIELVRVIHGAGETN
ncbi:MAG: hypothetical protein ACE145_12775 [Terriglobia bacterium]